MLLFELLRLRFRLELVQSQLLVPTFLLDIDGQLPFHVCDESIFAMLVFSSAFESASLLKLLQIRLLVSCLFDQLELVSLLFNEVNKCRYLMVFSF
jgi:hypothetical protein